MTKILHVSFSEAGGAGLFAKNLVKTLNLLERDVASLTYITSQSLREKPFRDIGITLRATVDEYLIRKQDYPTNFSYFRNTNNRKIIRKISQHRGIVHFHWMNGILNFRKLNQLVEDKSKIIWTCHDMEFFTGGCHYSLDCSNFSNGCEKCPAVKSIFRQLPQKQLENKLHFSIRNRKKINLVFPTRWMHDKFMESSLSRFYYASVIENSIDDVFLKTKTINRLNANKEDYLTVGFVSNWIENPVKNFITLTKIISEIGISSNTRIKILAVGDTMPRNFSQNLVNTEYSGKVTSRDEMIDLYKKMDLLVSISHGESFGLAIAEAASLGVPTLTMSNLASSELVIDGKTGFVCKDYSVVKEKLMHALDNKSLLNWMGENALNEAHKRWNPKTNAKKYLKIYEKIELE